MRKGHQDETGAVELDSCLTADVEGGVDRTPPLSRTYEEEGHDRRESGRVEKKKLYYLDETS